MARKLRVMIKTIAVIDLLSTNTFNSLTNFCNRHLCNIYPANFFINLFIMIFAVLS